MIDSQRIVILGLALTSSWGNGHATTYRGLVRELVRRGHDVLFLERDGLPLSEHRDLPFPPCGSAELYASVQELRDRFTDRVREADLVIVGSHVQDGIEIGHWVCSTAQGTTAFYDLDTPVTLAALASGTCAYMSEALVPRFDLYLSFSGGSTLTRLERQYGARSARPFYCSFDSAAHFPEPHEPAWDLGYMGAYCATRQTALDRLFLGAARLLPERRFVVAGPGYPDDAQWPAHMERISNVPAAGHRGFYGAQRFTLNLTRADMARAGYSPSVRLFEAAACGVPIISDYWEGLETIFEPGAEILIAESARDTLRFLTSVPERTRISVGRRARKRVLARHTAEHRAVQLEEYLDEVRAIRTASRLRRSKGACMMPLATAAAV